MTKPNLLFICTYNQWRSLTAEMIFKKDPNFNVKSAGISPNARHQISQKDLEWADLILCMENRHAEAIKIKFRNQPIPPIEILDIDSGYRYMDEELISLLKEKVGNLLPQIKNSRF